uniref:Peptidase M13 N-terminal domain-containing protein n=1 Tax=Romanomermis culicivorax TaxID=13658 RepID=A0A915HKY5_ROMCU
MTFFASLLIIFVMDRKFSPVLNYDHEGWNSASNNLLMGLDLKFDPCGNFYQFSTGSSDSLKKDDVKESNSFEDFKASLQKPCESKLKTINSSSPDHAQWLYNFYTKCMENFYNHDRDLLKDIGEKLTTHFVNQTTPFFSNVSSRYSSFWQLIGRLQRQQDTKFLIEARVEPIEIKCKKLMVLVLKPADTLPDRLYKNLPLYSKVIDFLRIYNQSIISEGEAFLNRMKQYLKYSNFTSSKNRTPVLLKLSKLSKFAPAIDWDDYLPALLSEEYFPEWKKDDPFLLLSDQHYFQDFLPEIMNNFSLDLQTYLAYGLLVHEYYDFFKMDKKTNHTVLQATSNHQEGICFDIALDYFSAAFVNLLLRGIEDQHVEDWIYDIEIIAESIFSAFKFLINNLSWLQPTQRILLIKKVGSFSVNIGLPPWIGDDQEINKRTPRYESSLSLVENDIKAQQSLFFNDILRPLMVKSIDGEGTLAGGSRGDYSQMATSILTPKFSDQVTRLGTKINIPFGAMVSQLYQDTAPLSMKFSRLGMLTMWYA